MFESKEPVPVRSVNAAINEYANNTARQLDDTRRQRDMLLMAMSDMLANRPNAYVDGLKAVDHVLRSSTPEVLEVAAAAKDLLRACELAVVDEPSTRSVLLPAIAKARRSSSFLRHA